MKHRYPFSFYRINSLGDGIALLCCMGMVAGLFFSRALLSAGMLVLFLNALAPSAIRKNWKAWKSSPFALLSFTFFCTYLLSGLWSENKAFWLASTINKLPFAVLPFAFFSAPLRKEWFQRIVIASLGVLQIAVIIYSLTQLGLHSEYYLRGYHVSRPLPTTRYDDHIRFSLSLVFSILMFAYLLWERQEKPLSRGFRVFIIAAMILFIAYIHILAAKTGLLCLYLMATLYILFKIYRQNKARALLLALGVAVVPMMAYWLIPTFKTKIDYVFYEINKSKNEDKYDYTLSDAGRMITYDLGTQAIARHPLAGVGAGDIMDEMKTGYNHEYPEVAVNQQYGPINQFMYTALCVGIPLSLFLLALSLVPFFYTGPGKIYLMLTGLVLLISMMVESMLELQFGVFAYLFFLLFWINVLKKDKPILPKPINDARKP